MMPPPVTVGGSSIGLLTAPVHGPGAICVAILRCSVAALLGVASATPALLASLAPRLARNSPQDRRRRGRKSGPVCLSMRPVYGEFTYDGHTPPRRGRNHPERRI